ncbi:MAG: isoprenylcysteine carboxylmethyltransferase family protein [Thiohalorhabdus sp.]|uniref:isoprenylcysteine carboxylmethyltransferase family protein n=1 Tax=Thiohalorhabdus sp. TaxID=3094134 RepID=UPI00397E9A32
MAPPLYVLFLVALGLRLGSLWISRRNEQRLRAQGAVESGARTSRLLAVLHTAIYLGCLIEGIIRGAQFDTAAQAALGVYALAMLALGMVIRALRPVWTVKLLFLPDHPVNRGWLFRRVRHPNYLFNLIPEVVSLPVVFDAWITLAVLVPVYLVVLGIRVMEEERVLRTLPDAGSTIPEG